MVIIIVKNPRSVYSAYNSEIFPFPLSLFFSLSLYQKCPGSWSWNKFQVRAPGSLQIYGNAGSRISQMNFI